MPEGIAQAPAFMLSNMSHDLPCTHVRVNHHLVVPIFDLSSGILPVCFFEWAWTSPSFETEPEGSEKWSVDCVCLKMLKCWSWFQCVRLTWGFLACPRLHSESVFSYEVGLFLNSMQRQHEREIHCHTWPRILPLQRRNPEDIVHKNVKSPE